MALVDPMPGERVSSWIRGHPLVFDCVVAGVLTVACVAWGMFTRVGLVAVLVSPLLVLPLAVRRIGPSLCLAGVFAGAVAQWLTVLATDGVLAADIALPVAVHAATAYGRVWTGRAALVVTALTAGVGARYVPLLPSPLSTHLLVAAFAASTLLAAWLTGALSRLRRRQVRALADRARLLEVERDQRDQLAVLAERTRIAREMHDVVAHSLVGVIAQADGGLYAASPQAGTAALATIGDHARRALAETRRVLGVLRDDTTAVDRELSPPYGVGDLPDLVDRIRGGGLPVDLTLELPATPEPGLSLAAYRIVQEGLTNVIKHAGTGSRAARRAIATVIVLPFGSR